MGKQPGPSPEELEFIFRCFIRGLSDRDILDEMEDTEFPVRNPRFIHERRRHFDAAKKLFEGEVHTNAAAAITNQRKEHFTLLAEIANSLLVNGMEDVYCTGEHPYGATITIGGLKGTVELPEEELIDVLVQNVDAARIRFGEYDFYSCFIPHLEAESREFATLGIDEYIEEKPFAFIDMLRLLVRRKTFKGKCPVCADL